MQLPSKESFDRTNAVIAAGVFVIALIVYAMTVQRTFSFWDCGEFIACSYILGIPHPPGTPLFVLIGRIFSIIPFVEDIAYRINYISVISSAATALFSYLLIVRLVGYFFGENRDEKLNKIIAYVGGIAGAFFVAWGETNWANSVEAEVYGLALALSVSIVWLTTIYFEKRGTKTASQIMIVVFYLAHLGVGIHMTVFLVVPVVSLFFILKKEATKRDWLMVCSFVILELLLIILFSNGRGGTQMFYMFTAILGLVLLAFVYRSINWAVLLAIGAVSSIMLSFSLYLWVTPVALGMMIVLGILSKKFNWSLNWRAGLMIIIAAALGWSVHLFIPLRSDHDPRIDENNPSRDWQTFVNFLDRKQYGQESMIERMFHRRGAWSNQFGRHPHMGYWSYFEEQYSQGGIVFIVPFFALGLLGMMVAINKRLELGLPFLVLFLVCSVGLILYMNFADGTKYDFQTGDAYLEVRDRDYFFTPAFVFFGIAMGMGVSSVMTILKEHFGKTDPGKQKLAVGVSSLLVLLPLVSLANNYHTNDRSDNYIPYNYAANILDTCEQNAILFTSGDNDTFPLWCIQEVYDYRKDVTVINLSLLNTDWYVAQMKHRYDVPISLTDEQILWYPVELPGGGISNRPREMFTDRPRQRRAYLTPSIHGGRVVKVQDMMVDEIVIENKWRRPIFFSSPPYAESPLKLRDRTTSVGILFRLDQNPPQLGVDTALSIDYFVNTYRYSGFEDSHVYRDENATGVFIGVGVSAVRLYDTYIATGDTTRALQIADLILKNYPEYWQMYVLRADVYDKAGDTAQADQLYYQLHDTLTSFLVSNPSNLFYMQDLGLAKTTLGERVEDQAMVQDGINLIWRAFDANSNSNYAFRKLVTVLAQQGNFSEIQKAANQFAEYKQNLEDPYLQRILGISDPRSFAPAGM